MKKALLLLVSFIVVELLVSLVVNACFGLVSTSADVSMDSYKEWSMGLSLVLANLIMIGVTYAVLYKHEGNPFASYFGMSSGKFVLLTILALVALFFPINGMIEVFSLPDLLEKLMSSMIHNPLCVIGIAIIGPVAEEVCFRRGILGSLLETERFRKYALVISALIFSLVHGNPPQMIAAFILGLFLGWLYMRTHSLVLPIACHVINNSTSVILGWIFGEKMKLEDFFPDHTIFYVSMAVSALIFVFLFMRLRKTDEINKSW